MVNVGYFGTDKESELRKNSLINLSCQLTDTKCLNEILTKFGVKDDIISPLVSIVVPTYNNAEFLPRCLLSLVQQTLKDIEIIIVNDGSTDETNNILSAIKDKDKRFKIVQQEHKMQGAARNAGMEIAIGEYIGFVDSDDWVDLDYFEKLYNSAKKYNSDIALATNVRIGNGKTKYRLNLTEEKFVTSIQDKIDIGKQVKNPCPTNKIYREKMLMENNIRWPEGVYCEDKLFTTQAIYYSNGVVSVPEVNYYYYRNPNSTVNTKTKKHFAKLLNDKNSAKKSVVEFFRNHNVECANKKYWYTKKIYKIFNLTILEIKESIKTKRYIIFGLLPVLEACI